MNRISKKISMWMFTIENQSNGSADEMKLTTKAGATKFVLHAKLADAHITAATKHS